MNQSYTGTLAIVECCTCHMDFGMTTDYYNARRRDHGWFRCPAGHQQHFTGKSDIEKERSKTAAVKRQRDRLEVEKAALPSDVRQATDRAKSYRYARAQRGAFWRGFEDRNCGVCIDACPYSENGRGGFRRAWFDGYGVEDPAWAPVVAEETV